MHAKNLNKFAASPSPNPIPDPVLATVPSPLPACLHIAHTQCGTTFNYVKQAVGQAGRLAGNTSQWHHQKRISVIRAGAERAGETVTGTIAVGRGGRQRVPEAGRGTGSHLLCHFMAVPTLFVAVAVAVCLLPLCLLFASFFAWKITRTNARERGRGRGRNKTLCPSPRPCNNCVKQFSA